VASVYVVCPGGEYDPYEEWVEEAMAVIRSDHPDLHAWDEPHIVRASQEHTFNPLDLYASVHRTVGPVLFVGGIKSSAIAIFETKLGQRAIVRRCIPTCSTDLYESLIDLMKRHEKGEPEISQRFAVALMLIAKLERMNYWGGLATAKNFMSVHMLAKGNGLDEKYKGPADNVADYLASEYRQIQLLSKKTGDGNVKYACNNNYRSDVYTFLRERTVADDQLMTWFSKDSMRVSARELDCINPDDYRVSR
jgi:hypothetical protein